MDSSKRKKAELEEEIDVLGQENEEEASKWVIETLDGVEAGKKQEYDDALQAFSDKNKKFRTYYEALARQLDYLLKYKVDWLGHKFEYQATFNKARGVGVMVKDPLGRIFARGFKPSGEPKYDLHALKVLIYQTENVIEEYEEKNAESLQKKVN